MDEHTGAARQTVKVRGRGNNTIVSGRDVVMVHSQDSGRRGRAIIAISVIALSIVGSFSVYNSIIGVSIIDRLIGLTATLAGEVHPGAPSIEPRSPAEGTPANLPAASTAGGDTAARARVASGSRGERAPATSSPRQEGLRDSAAWRPPLSAGAVPAPQAGHDATLETNRLATTDGRSIFVNPRYLQPGACAPGTRAVLNGPPGTPEIPVDCTNGELVVRVLDAGWADGINPNTLYCLTFATPGGERIRFPDDAPGAGRVLTAERYIGFQIALSVTDTEENRKLVLTNTPGTNGTMPCHI